MAHVIVTRVIMMMMMMSRNDDEDNKEPSLQHPIHLTGRYRLQAHTCVRSGLCDLNNQSKFYNQRIYVNLDR